MKEGDIVMFHTPMNESEKTAQYVVLEMRGERVLVQDLHSKLLLGSQQVFSVSDLQIVYEC